MRGLDKTKIIIAASAAIIVLLTIFALVRDTTHEISRAELKAYLAKGAVKQVVEKERVYLIRTPEGRFSIAKSQVPAGAFDAIAVETEEGSTIILSIVTLLFVIGIASIGLRYWLKHRNGAPPFPATRRATTCSPSSPT